MIIIICALLFTNANSYVCADISVKIYSVAARLEWPGIFEPFRFTFRGYFRVVRCLLHSQCKHNAPRNFAGFVSGIRAL